VTLVTVLRGFTPPFVASAYRHFRHKAKTISFSDNYQSWEEALKDFGAKVT
jgi:hypothetical protein